MKSNSINTSIVDLSQQYLDSSPTPYHAVENAVTLLQENGFQALDERENWKIQSGGKYFIVRGGSSIIAFNAPSTQPFTAGIRAVGAHTDSPCLKVKPQPQRRLAGVEQLAVDVYGGAILNTWFDRDLTLAGKIVYEVNNQILTQLVHLSESIAYLPNLAIHLNRDVNSKNCIDRQQHLHLVLTDEGKSPLHFNDLLIQILQKNGVQKVDLIASFDLCVVDTQPAKLTGLNRDFLASSRIDNLLSCIVALKSLIVADDNLFNVAVFYDHEEVGSQSYQGGAGLFLEQVLRRLVPDVTDYSRMLANSLFISADGAHALHPNFLEQYEPNHAPIINRGVVIKHNFNQRYATNCSNSALIQSLARQQDLTLQQFVVRGNLGCGSTIGPITASNLGIDVIDIGVAQWAMHSARELVGRKDIIDFEKLLTAFYQLEQLKYD